jgi:hypothetical protein
LFYTFDCRNSRFCLCIPFCVSLSSHSLPFRKSDLSPEFHPLESGSFIVVLVFEGAYLKSLAPCGHFDFLSTGGKMRNLTCIRNALYCSMKYLTRTWLLFRRAC